MKPIPPPDNCRPLIYPVRGNHGETFKVEAKGRGFRKVLGTLPTRAEAFDAYTTWVTTGVLPAPAKRGPKGPQKASRQPRSVPAKKPVPPRPAVDPAKANRLEMIKRLAAAHR